ncbi:hypothetical protein DFQ27_004280 [Actinomortierella ambigua]|uniref:Uncharacterized protein n=1 Tax=Actinomortierella ambigua TaxID=1343610 RepID=A0A9P6QMN6_9FUNG|nr:hypothetical protein DFQ27_004280 [Actinomortierella ambigua]
MTYSQQHEKQQPLHYHHHHRSDTTSAEQPQVRQETTTTTISSTTTTTSSSVPFTSDSEPSMYNSTSGRHTQRLQGAATSPMESVGGIGSGHLRSSQQQQQQQQQRQPLERERYPGDSTESLDSTGGHARQGKQAQGGSNGHGPTNNNSNSHNSNGLGAGAGAGAGSGAPRPKTRTTSSASSQSSGSSSGAPGSRRQHQHQQHQHQQHQYGNERQRAAAEAHDHSGGVHSWPILFAIIPPLGALIFDNSAIWSDILTLSLIAFFLYNIIKVPWELYYAARTRRVLLSSVSSNVGTQDPVLEMRRQVAARSLRRQEFFSLILVLSSPFLGGYTLRYLKTFFSSYENYLSALNIELFIIASAIRPLTHLVSLLKARALHLQDQVHYPSTDVEVLKRRVATMETELNQLRRLVATKREVLMEVQDNFEPTLLQLTKQIKRHDKREVLLRSYTEERFAQVEEKLREYETLLTYRLTEEQQHRASLLFLPLNLMVAMLGYFTYFLPARLTGAGHAAVTQKQPPAMLASAPAPQAIGDGRAIAAGPGAATAVASLDANGGGVGGGIGGGGGVINHGHNATTTTTSTTTTAHHLHAGHGHLSHRSPFEPLRETTRVY